MVQFNASMRVLNNKSSPDIHFYMNIKKLMIYAPYTTALHYSPQSIPIELVQDKNKLNLPSRKMF
jgi:hypothetical protein